MNATGLATPAAARDHELRAPARHNGVACPCCGGLIRAAAVSEERPDLDMPLLWEGD